MQASFTRHLLEFPFVHNYRKTPSSWARQPICNLFFFSPFTYARKLGLLLPLRNPSRNGAWRTLVSLLDRRFPNEAAPRVPRKPSQGAQSEQDASERGEGGRRAMAAREKPPPRPYSGLPKDARPAARGSGSPYNRTGYPTRRQREATVPTSSCPPTWAVSPPHATAGRAPSGSDTGSTAGSRRRPFGARDDPPPRGWHRETKTLRLEREREWRAPGRPPVRRGDRHGGGSISRGGDGREGGQSRTHPFMAATGLAIRRRLEAPSCRSTWASGRPGWSTARAPVRASHPLAERAQALAPRRRDADNDGP